MNEECGSTSTQEQADTIIKVIREHPGYTKMELWRTLPYPQGMNYSTFSDILCSLLKGNKVARDIDDHICWIYNPDLVQKYSSRDDLRVVINE